MNKETGNDRTASRAAWKTYRAVSHYIRQGRFQPGQRIAPVRELAEKFGVNFLTVIKALNWLERDGAIEKRPRSGVFVGNMPSGHGSVELREIALVVPEAFSFAKDIVSGVAEACGKHGILLRLCVYGNEPAREIGFVESSLRADGCGAIAVSRKTRQAMDLYRGIAAQGGNVLYLGRPPADIRLPAVYCDDIYGGALVAGHFLGQGAARMLYLSLDSADPVGDEERYAGFLDSLDGKYRAWASAHSRRGLAGDKAVFRLLDRMRRNGDMPDAIFCNSDPLAAAVARLLSESKLTVPGNVMLAGYDDLELARHLPVPLTSCAAPRHEMGRAAVEALTLFAQTGEINQKIFRPRLIVRESSARKAAMLSTG